MAGILAMLANLFGCARPDDGPGMVYIDSNYRTDYANTLPFDEIDGYPVWAVEYIGSGEEGRARRDSVVSGRFSSLGDEALSQVEHVDLGGEYWYLVIPRYNSIIEVYPRDGELSAFLSPYGVPFTLCCGDGTVIKNCSDGASVLTFISGNGEVPAVRGDVWDITDGF